MVSVERFPKLAGTTIVAVGHRARQGKDVAALAIQQANPRVHIERFAFGDAIKVLARVRYGMRAKDGSLLQHVGDQERAADPYVFMRTLYYTIAERAPQVALITDLRTEGEMDFVKRLGGFAIRIERHDGEGQLVLPKDRDPNHPTEVALANSTLWDAYLTNHEGRIDDFRLQAIKAFKSIMLLTAYSGRPKAA